MATHPDFSRVRAIWRFSLFLLLTVICAPIHFILVKFFPQQRFFIPYLWHGYCCRIFGIQLEIKGQIANKEPVLFVANHVSYLDILILGSLLPATFISKIEVQSWFLIGWLATLQNTIFIERHRRQLKGQLDTLQRHFEQKNNLILFAEGTTTDGSAVLPFKSALFQSFENCLFPVAIQPVSLAYKSYSNQPITQELRNYYAWFTDISAGAHMFSMAGMKGVTVEVIFHPSVTSEQFNHRKELAEYTQQQVALGVLRGLANV